MPSEQPPDVQLETLGMNFRLSEDAPRDRVFFVPTRKTVERALGEGRNPDRYFETIRCQLEVFGLRHR
jgi:hypothetical protein